VIVPSTSLSLVEAWLPVIVVLSALAVPKLATPPPMPTPNRPVAPGWPGVAVPLPAAVTPPPAPACPPEALAAMLPAMKSVALACLEPFFAPSWGLVVRVPVVALKMPPPEPIPPSPPTPPLAMPPSAPPVPLPPLPPGPPAPPVAWSAENVVPLCQSGTVTFVYAARDEEHNSALVLKDHLEHPSS
jgi:hypothetical protein